MTWYSRDSVWGHRCGTTTFSPAISSQPPGNSGLDFVNWQVLRRSFGTWLKIAGADVKDTQALMRHSRVSTTMDIYVQDVPESQRSAVDHLSKMVN